MATVRDLLSAVTLRIVRPFLRLFVLALSFASLQLTLLAGGPACAIPGSHLAHTGEVVAGMDMGGMDMGGMDMTGMDMASAGRGLSEQVPGPHPASGLPEHGPCDESSAPQACQSMAPCLFAALTTVAQVNAAESPAPSAVIAALIAAPPSATSAPESPPPRA